MRRTTRTAALSALLALPLAAPLAAETFSGTVNGEARDWHLEVDGESGTAWHAMGMFTQATIFGFPDPGNPGDVTGALELSLTLRGPDDALTPMAGYATYYAEGWRQLYVSADEDADITVTLHAARIEGETLHLAGTVEADLQRLVDITTEELDPDDRLQITVSFDLALPAQ